MKIHFPVFCCVVILLASMQTGCSVDESELAVQLPLKELAGEIDEQVDTPATEEDSEVSSLPFPNRENPFVFVSSDYADRSSGGKGENGGLKLFGFMGDESPRVIFQVDGETKTLAVGETWKDLEVLEILPPEVRIKVDGVIRNWSLLGNRELQEES